MTAIPAGTSPVSIRARLPAIRSWIPMGHPVHTASATRVLAMRTLPTRVSPTRDMPTRDLPIRASPATGTPLGAMHGGSGELREHTGVSRRAAKDGGHFYLVLVVPGLVPGIHVLDYWRQIRG